MVDVCTPHCTFFASSSVVTCTPLSALIEHALVRLEVGLAEVDDLLALVGDRDLRQREVVVRDGAGDDRVEADVAHDHLRQPALLLDRLREVVLVAARHLRRVAVAALPEPGAGQARDDGERVGRDGLQRAVASWRSQPTSSSYWRCRRRRRRHRRRTPSPPRPRSRAERTFACASPSVVTNEYRAGQGGWDVRRP